jgi:hypothetical protein
MPNILVGRSRAHRENRWLCCENFSNIQIIVQYLVGFDYSCSDACWTTNFSRGHEQYFRAQQARNRPVADRSQFVNSTLRLKGISDRDGGGNE